MPRKRSQVLIPLPPIDSATRTPEEPRSFLRLDITERQLEILGWVAKGKSSTDIAAILGISHRTVEHHLETIRNNFGVRTSFQAVLKVRDLGLIGAEAPRGRATPPHG